MSEISDWINRQISPVTSVQTADAIGQVRAQFPIIDWIPEILGAFIFLQVVILAMVASLRRGHG